MEPPTVQEMQDRAVLLLVSGMSIADVERYAVGRGLTPLQAADIVKTARNRITIAADYARDEQLGKAVMRLEDLYAKSMTAKDTRTALQAQRELNRLLSLYSTGEKAEAAEEQSDESSKRLELIAGYLLPLKLASDQYPVEEHARLAAEIIRSQKPLGSVP